MNKKLKRYLDTLTKNGQLRNLWFALTISYLGDAFYQLAVAWFVYSETGSSLQVGLIFVAQFLPNVLLGPFLGVIVDRYNRKRLMQIAQLSQILATGVLALSILSGFFELWLLYAVTILLSIGSLVFFPAQRAWVPHLVKEDQLLIANSLFSSSREIANLIGGLLGGTVVVLFGASLAIGFDALTFVVALLFIQLIKYVPEQKVKTKLKETSGRLKKVFLELQEGFGWLSEHLAMMWMLILATIANMALSPVNILLPMLVQNVFHADASALGIFDASLGFGVLLGGIFIGIISPGRVGFLFGTAMGVQGIGMLVVAISPILPVAYVGTFILGFMLIVGSLPVSSAFQLLVPSHLRGRVAGVNNMISSLAIPISYGFVGALGDTIGAKSCFLLSFLLFLACMVCALLTPSLRRFQTGKPSLHGEGTVESK